MQIKTSLTRRRMLNLTIFGGAAGIVSACQFNPEMMGAALGGAGAEANWLELGKELDSGLSLMAGQTDKLLEIQADYAGVMDLKNLEAKLRAEVVNLRRGDTFGASNLRTATTLSKNAQKDIVRQVNRAGSLSSQQQRVLARGQQQHEQAIQAMWVGVVRIGKVFIDARNAKRPSIGDIELINVARNITTTAPRALAFGKTSRETYEAYNEAFEFKGVYVPPKNRISNLPVV